MKTVLGMTIVALLSPLGAGAQPLKPTPQFQASMDLAVALRSGDVAKALAGLTDDAVVLPPGRDLVGGRKGLEATLKELLDNYGVELAIVSIGSMASGELGFDAGLYELTLSPKGGAPKIKRRGKYLTALRRDGEERWRVAYLSWNESEPLPK